MAMRINYFFDVVYSLYGLFLQNSIFILQTLEYARYKGFKIEINIYYSETKPLE
jgi:hypothetical protein